MDGWSHGCLVRRALPWFVGRSIDRWPRTWPPGAESWIGRRYRVVPGFVRRVLKTTRSSVWSCMFFRRVDGGIVAWGHFNEVGSCCMDVFVWTYYHTRRSDHNHG